MQIKIDTRDDDGEVIIESTITATRELRIQWRAGSSSADVAVLSYDNPIMGADLVIDVRDLILAVRAIETHSEWLSTKYTKGR